jgi:hypothetical protein
VTSRPTWSRFYGVEISHETVAKVVEVVVEEVRNRRRLGAPPITSRGRRLHRSSCDLRQVWNPQTVTGQFRLRVDLLQQVELVLRGLAQFDAHHAADSPRRCGRVALLSRSSVTSTQLYNATNRSLVAFTVNTGSASSAQVVKR